MKLEKGDYYMEDGKLVFTEQFHLRKGKCCHNGCRHCPYEPKHIKGNIELEEQYKNKKDGNS